MTTTIGTAQLDAIARGLKAHGTGPANVARLAKMFNVTEASIADALALANAAVEAVTESADAKPSANVNPVTLDRAQRFRGDVIAAEAKPLGKATTADLENLVAATFSR